MTVNPQELAAAAAASSPSKTTVTRRSAPSSSPERTADHSRPPRPRPPRSRRVTTYVKRHDSGVSRCRQDSPSPASAPSSPCATQSRRCSVVAGSTVLRTMPASSIGTRSCTKAATSSRGRSVDSRISMDDIMAIHVCTTADDPSECAPMDEHTSEPQAGAWHRRSLLKGGVLGAGIVAAGTAFDVAEAAPGRTTRRHWSGHFRDPDTPDWHYLPFTMPHGVRSLEVSYDFHPQDTGFGFSTNVVDIGIFDSSGKGLGNADGFRGWSGGARRH